MLSIRTQDRKALIPYDDNIEIIVWKSGIWIVKGTKTLGTYKTKERALEVLDEIESYVVGKVLVEENIKVMNESTYPGDSVYRDTTKETLQALPQVYQMPKE